MGEPYEARSTENVETRKSRRFRKRPGVVEAMRWDGSEDSQRAIVRWSENRISGWFDSTYFLEVPTLHGLTQARTGDWIIRGPQGDYWPCRPDIFEATYEPVSE